MNQASGQFKSPACLCPLNAWIKSIRHHAQPSFSNEPSVSVKYLHTVIQQIIRPFSSCRLKFCTH